MFIKFSPIVPSADSIFSAYLIRDIADKEYVTNNSQYVEIFNLILDLCYFCLYAL